MTARTRRSLHRAENGRHRAAPTRRAHRRADGLWAIAIGVPLGLVACGGMVWQASYSAFTARTETAGSSWGTGTLTLNGAPASVVLTETDLAPSDAYRPARCIKIVAGGTVQASARMYAEITSSPGDDTTAMANNLDIKVERGTWTGTGPNNNGDCGTSFTPEAGQVFTGTFASFTGTHPSWANGFSPWDTISGTTNVTKAYRIQVKLNKSAPSTLQGKTLTTKFTWEAQTL